VAAVLHKSTAHNAETKLTQKQAAEIASMSVFGVGLVGVYIVATRFKDEFSDFTIAAIATIMFVAFYVLGQWEKRRINRPPTVK
jgi:energy-converting hydrogenase Eha subunit C